MDQPFSVDEQRSGVHTVLERAQAPDGLRPRCMANVVGCSGAMIELFSLVERVSATESTALITGESGTGKELVARAMHENSPRRSGPMVVVNCGAIPEALLESEMFGHARGAFTGAVQARVGRVGAARGGTLFLDEIGELPLALQVKLLRLLQQREYCPVGDSRTLKADVRIIAATNKELEAEVLSGAFREDLYYRLNVIHLRVPALRDRLDDIPELAAHFLRTACERVGRAELALCGAAMQVLIGWPWPGNVRELENAMERAAILCRAELVQPEDLPARMLSAGEPQRPAQLPEAGLDLRAAVESYENELIRQALERTSWNKNRAARLLGLNRTTLVEMLKRKRLVARVA